MMSLSANEEVKTGDHIYSRSSQFCVLRLGELPKLPRESENLQAILRRFDCVPCSHVPKLTKQKNRKMLKRRLNGFIAFRSFYSRRVNSSLMQKELSSLLGQVWKREPNRSVWICYALQYNETGGEENFIDWLYRNLGLASTTRNPRKQISRACKSHGLENVEDVFLE